jgi:hypothetical protein
MVVSSMLKLNQEYWMYACEIQIYCYNNVKYYAGIKFHCLPCAI